MKYAPVAGRIMFAIPFLMFGFGHMADAQTMADSGMVPAFLPAPTIIVYLTGLLLIAAGGAVLVGYRTKLAALVLAGFLLSTVLFVWGSGFMAGDQMATGMFMKDLGLAGAALMMSHFGAGPNSMDAKAAE